MTKWLIRLYVKARLYYDACREHIFEGNNLQEHIKSIEQIMKSV